jgi:DNA-binding transcriptional ArsR family regulator
MEESKVIAALSALAQPQRLRIFRALVRAGPTGMTPGALSAVLDTPASTLSFHLKELTHAGLVLPERDGRHLHYRPQIERMNDLLGYLMAHCCEAAVEPGACSPATPRSRLGC